MSNTCWTQSMIEVDANIVRIGTIYNIFGYSYVSYFCYRYIWLFIPIIFLIQLYLDINFYHMFDTNIFGYLFVSYFCYKYIRIFVRIKINKNVTLWCEHCKVWLSHDTAGPTRPQDETMVCSCGLIWTQATVFRLKRLEISKSFHRWNKPPFFCVENIGNFKKFS